MTPVSRMDTPATTARSDPGTSTSLDMGMVSLCNNQCVKQ